MKRIVKYIPSSNRLVYFHSNATPEYWDNIWINEGPPAPIERNHDVLRLTRKYLPQGSKVLEAGCGRGDKVNAMALSGFNSFGIDFAPNTVNSAQIQFPNCKIQHGDVRNLEFENSSFDGYWSIGVIEHFWSGYEKILSEAHRVLRPGGYLFLSTPSFSPYRQYKARKGHYPVVDPPPILEPKDFYQFALGREEIESAIKRHGFEQKYWGGRAPEISMMEDMTGNRHIIDWLLGSRGGITKRITRRLVSLAFSNWCGHSFISVSRKNPCNKYV